jgi:hypothetical protein
MPKIANIEGVGTLSFPDDTPDEVVAQSVQKYLKGSVGELRRREGQEGLGGSVESNGGVRLREMESRPVRSFMLGRGGVGPATVGSKMSVEDIEKEYQVRKASEESDRRLAATAAKVGIPLAAAVAFPPAAGATIPELLALTGGYSLAGAGGELVGQVIEGKNEPSKVLGAAVRSANVNPVGQIVRPMATQAAANLTARYVEEGGITPGGAALDVGFPALLGTLGAAGRSLRGGADVLEEGAKRAGFIERMAKGLRATVGQAFPELAAFEQRMSAKTSGGRKLAGQLEEQQRLLVDELNRIKGGESGGVQDVANRLGKVFGVEEGNTLANQLQGINDIERALEKVRGTAQEQVLRQASNDAIDQLSARAQKALVGGPAPVYRAVQSGEQFETLAESLKSGLQNKANQIYAPANKYGDDAIFTLDPDIQALGKKLLGQIPDINASGLGSFKDLLSRRVTVPARASMDPTAPMTVSEVDKVTHNELKGVIKELFDFADTAGEAIGTRGQSQVRELAKKISQSTSDQVQKLLPTDAANAVVQGNQFYAQNRPLLDAYAVRKLFAPDTMRTGQGAEAAVSGIRRQGLDAPEIANLLKAHESLKASGAVVPRIDPILSNIRSGILSEFVDPVTGAIQPKSFEGLAERLLEIERQTPGSLSKLKFGSTGELSDFVMFLRKNKDLAGPEATEKLLRTGTPGFTVVSTALDMAPNVQTAKTMMNYLQRQAATGNAAAVDALQGVRARAIEELMLTTAGGTRQFSIGRALNELADPVRRAQIEAIIGPRLINTIDTQFGPGLRVMAESERAAGRAGTTVGGAQIEELISGTERGAANLASGRPGTALLSAVSTLFRNRKYNALANLMAGGAGSAGLRTRAGQLRAWDRILNAPGTTGERAINSSIREALRETIEEQQQETSPE